VVRAFPLEERLYRHRCVEAWAMAVPWTGFPLAALLKQAEPQPGARYVRFESFDRPAETSRQSGRSDPWPYTEGLTLAEATNELAFIATGMYGHALLKQHGAPVRLVVPWKYGFKSAKSIVRIELTAEKPATFWNTVSPHEYGFEANVDPAVPHPRWSQAAERMLGTREVRETQRFNGYGEWVGNLYRT
jgi:sulfoxide reductase catalytic subunit YedY